MASEAVKSAVRDLASLGWFCGMEELSVPTVEKLALVFDAALVPERARAKALAEACRMAEDMLRANRLVLGEYEGSGVVDSVIVQCCAAYTAYDAAEKGETHG